MGEETARGYCETKLIWLGGAHTSVSKFLWPFRFKVKRPNVKQK